MKNNQLKKHSIDDKKYKVDKIFVLKIILTAVIVIFISMLIFYLWVI